MNFISDSKQAHRHGKPISLSPMKAQIQVPEIEGSCKGVALLMPMGNAARAAIQGIIEG